MSDVYSESSTALGSTTTVVASFRIKPLQAKKSLGISVRRGVKLLKASHTISFDKTLEFAEAVGHLAFLRLYLRDYHEPLEEEKCPFRDA